MKRSQLLMVLLQVVLDVALAAAAFALAYRINLWRDPSVGGFGLYLPQMIVFVGIVIAAIFTSRLYTRRRGQPRLEELWTLVKAITFGTLIAVAVISFAFKNAFDYRRPMMVLAWVLCILLLTLGRFLHIQIQRAFLRRGIGSSDVLLVGTGEVARMVLQKMLHLSLIHI